MVLVLVLASVSAVIKLLLLIVYAKQASSRGISIAYLLSSIVGSG